MPRIPSRPSIGERVLGDFYVMARASAGSRHNLRLDLTFRLLYLLPVVVGAARAADEQAERPGTSGDCR